MSHCQEISRSAISALNPRSSRFSSVENDWRVSTLARSLSLVAFQYKRWDIFRANFELLFEQLERSYKPHRFTRIGLRYRNFIQPARIGLAGKPWQTLIAPHIAGPLTTNVDHVQKIQSTLTLGADAEGIAVTLNYGLQPIPDPDTGQQALAYVVDNDLYTEGVTDAEHVLPFLDRANRRAGRLFRWCITNELHDALRPDPSG